MCRMMMKDCFSKASNAQELIDIAKNQYEEVQQGLGDFAENKYGKQFDLSPLIKALDTYIKRYAGWSKERCIDHWCKVVGGLQRMLPAHVINEYCRPDRSFVVKGGPPDFLDATLPRKGLEMAGQELGLDWCLSGRMRPADKPLFRMGEKYGMTRSYADNMQAMYEMGYRLSEPSKHGKEYHLRVVADLLAISSLKAQRTQQIAKLPEELDAILEQSVKMKLT
jgi:hypothetical protein